MTRLLTLNFGTFLETSRFKQRALADGYVDTDAMYDNPPGALVRARGMREVSGAAKLYSFWGLEKATWEGNLAAGRTYASEFETWMTTVLSTTVDAVYLAGHHSGQKMWWVKRYKGNTFFYMSMETVGMLEFGIIEWNTGTRTTVVSVNADQLRTGCLLVIGSGCNICAGGDSSYYQRFFANGSLKPLVLGWESTIAIPPASEPSINKGFFDHLAAYWKASSVVPATGHRLSWLYSYDPMELIRAWGTGCSAYRTHSSSRRLWTNAHARHPDGTYYRFEWRAGKAEPVV
jgi:hypothetical protein